MAHERTYVRRKSGIGILCLLLLAACGRQPQPETQPGTPLSGQAASGLFFSEYVEGGSLNKALEIYNGTGAPVDLNAGGYTVQVFFNGSASPGATLALKGTVADGDVFVLADDGAAQAVLEQADQTSTVSFFNGDDAVVLRQGGADGPIVDAIGQLGVDPGSAWGSGDTSTQNRTLRRLATVCTGDKNPDDAFDPAGQWAGFAQDSFDGLGSHTAACGGEPGTPGPGSGGGSGGSDGGSEIGECTDPATLIHEVQGSGLVSPLEAQTVTVEGVVVGDFQADDGDAFNSDLGGFYIQEEPGDADADPATSEGVFVYAPGAADVNTGEVVRVRGEVAEFNGLTELAGVSLKLCGEADLPAPVGVTLPLESKEALEALEGMRVTFPQALVIADYFNFDRFGEVVLAAPPAGLARPFTPTSYVEPGPEAAAVADLNARSRVTLDDGRTAQNPDPARHPNGEAFTLQNRFRGGDEVQNATGVLDYRFGLYRLQPTQGADYTRKNPRPEAPEDVGGSLKVASFNVLNFFNGDGRGGGFPTARGADSQEDFERQQAKIVAALASIDADIFGLIELENDPSGETSAVDDLVDALNAKVGAGTYTYVDTGLIGTDAIRVGLLYKPEAVTPVGDYAVLDASDDPRFIDTKNRPALVQTFREEATGGVLTVAVNHFKSKGSGCGAGDDDPQQGSCNLTRRAAAEALVDFLAADPTGSGDPDVLIIGDLNAYDKEDPIDALREGADDALGTADDYTDLVRAFQGEFAYSYVFDAQFGYLDYALANQALAGQVTGTTEYHINADEPDILDYDTTFKQDAQDALYEPNPYRSSDHDPVVVGLSLTPSDAQAPVITLKRLGETLRPPDHKYATVNLAHIVASVSDNVDRLSAADVVITRVTSDEPENGEGDGNTVDDVVLGGCQTVKLRAERSGRGDGRVYTIYLAVSDAAGNVGAATYQVEVPKGNKGAVDSGEAYAVEGCEPL